MKLEGPLVLAGAGKMGGALLAGWLGQGLSPADVLVQDPSPPDEVKALLVRHGIRFGAGVGPLASPPAVIVMAVKPQAMDQVFPPLAGLAGPKTLLLSIAAGRTIAGFEAHLPPGSAVIRSMPNTPASIGRGITACVANAGASASHRALAEHLLSAVGDVVWLDREDLLDAVTAVSGSGPAYVFLLAECLAAAGVAAGLAPDLAARLARATVAGSGELLHRSDLPASTLRQNVTSPGGTTAAALAVLMGEGGLEPLLTRAVAAAQQRGRELAG